MHAANRHSTRIIQITIDIFVLGSTPNSIMKAHNPRNNVTAAPAPAWTT